MEATTLFFVITGVLSLGAIIVLLKMRTMDKYKIVFEREFSSSKMKYFVKIRRGLTYHYVKLERDEPGYENDVFITSPTQMFGQETEKLAEKIVYNHKMTMITGTPIHD